MLLWRVHATFQILFHITGKQSPHSCPTSHSINRYLLTDLIWLLVTFGYIVHTVVSFGIRKDKNNKHVFFLVSHTHTFLGKPHTHTVIKFLGSFKSFRRVQLRLWGFQLFPGHLLLLGWAHAESESIIMMATNYSSCSTSQGPFSS